MKLFKYSMGVVCALSLFTASARAEEAQAVAVLMPAPQHVSVEQTPKKIEKARPAAVKKQRKQERPLTPYLWQLENPQLG